MSISPSIAFDTVKNPIMPISNGKTLYVGGSGEGNYTTIQGAIDDASDGDTVFVYDESSPYKERIVVYKSISIIGEDRETTVIDGNYSGNIINISAKWVNISGFIIKNSRYGYPYWDTGIKISSNYNTITNNTILNNAVGIYLRDSNSNTITRNNITSNKNFGIYVLSSNGNIIRDNTVISNKQQGIQFRSSNYNNIESNQITEGIWFEFCCRYNTITENNISNGTVGISFYLLTNRNTIINNNILNNFIGINLNSFCSRNTIINNKILNNYWGISIDVFSNRNTIQSNNISNSSDWGIKLGFSNHNKIFNNNFFNNNQNVRFLNCWRNIWMQNYWNKSRILPKIIFGEFWIIFDIEFQWFNVDWFPARKPYDI